MTNRPHRPWPYWYEVREEYRDLFRLRPLLWWRDVWVLPLGVWLSQRAERSLYEVISPEMLREVLRAKEEEE